jgi:hypothetical protein
MTMSRLVHCSLGELESLFIAEPHASVPTGCHRGTYLVRLQTPGARARRNRLVEYVAFEAIPFGVDFRSCAWFFFFRQLQLGRFRPEACPSRWRTTEVIALHYESSRLPAPIRGILYDEIKPLTATVCLGLGGMNAERGLGDHFFFALERVAE